MPPNFIGNLRDKMWDLEDWPRDRAFGTVTLQPDPIVTAGKQLRVNFFAGSPRHRSMRGGTYLTIEKERANGSWEIVRTDADTDCMY